MRSFVAACLISLWITLAASAEPVTWRGVPVGVGRSGDSG